MTIQDPQAEAAPVDFESLTDEELLGRVYSKRDLLTTLELELAIRLEHALNEIYERPRREAMLDKLVAESQALGLYDDLLNKDPQRVNNP